MHVATKFVPIKTIPYRFLVVHIVIARNHHDVTIQLAELIAHEIYVVILDARMIKEVSDNQKDIALFVSNRIYDERECRFSYISIPIDGI